MLKLSRTLPLPILIVAGISGILSFLAGWGLVILCPFLLYRGDYAAVLLAVLVWLTPTAVYSVCLMPSFTLAVISSKFYSSEKPFVGFFFMVISRFWQYGVAGAVVLLVNQFMLSHFVRGDHGYVATLGFCVSSFPWIYMLGLSKADEIGTALSTTLILFGNAIYLYFSISYFLELETMTFPFFVILFFFALLDAIAMTAVAVSVHSKTQPASLR